MPEEVIGHDHYVVLGTADFRALVAGEFVEIVSNGHRVKIILSDIGFDVMIQAVGDAVLNTGRDTKSGRGLP